MTDTRFLPISAEDMRSRGWDHYDILYISGDAYVDHPSFGTAIIGRLVESLGFRIAILAQPDWRSCESFLALGKPALAVFVSAGNLDSMVAHYTVAKKPRSGDYYSPGGKAGLRPDRALTVYCRMARKAFPDLPIICGGLEASLRRFAHYDYWADRVMPSVLSDCGADLLIYGMGEHPIEEIVTRLAAGEPVSSLRDVRGTCYLTDAIPEAPFTYRECSPFEKVSADKLQYAQATRMQFRAQDHTSDLALVQRHGKRYLVQNPPSPPLTGEELDRVAELPYVRDYHPVYEAAGGVPAIEEVKFSITHNRGCFGGCSFCAIAFHQGRLVTARSHESVLREAELITKLPDFKGYINDVGGPTANFRAPACKKALTEGVCADRTCLAPKPCPALKADHNDYLELLRKIRALPGVKKVFIRSGIRFDYLMLDPDDTFLRELVEHHVSGQLRVAPEHCSANVLGLMGKPDFSVYEKFIERFRRETARIGKKQYVVPYLMSSHPGSTLEDAVKLAEYLHKNGLNPEQVQDFYPTPGTVSTCMYYTGLDPRTLKPVPVTRDPHEKALQRVLLQTRNPANHALIREALQKCGRQDLIGTGKGCLIPPHAPGGKARPPRKSGLKPKNQKGRK
ncbi:MAG: YgiQ family radical SAM protein [Clostridia bacterium]|nr:YgiQ family radical SAM protein [Clostridia bacterium]